MFQGASLWPVYLFGGACVLMPLLILGLILWSKPWRN